MLKIIFILSALAILVRSNPENNLLEKLGDRLNNDFVNLPKPGDLIYELNEEEYEDYLEIWLEAQYRTNYRESRKNRNGCSVLVNSLSEPSPVYVSGGKLLESFENTGFIEFSEGESVDLHCSGNNNGLTHSSDTQGPALATMVCQSGNSFTSPGWLTGQSTLGDVLCRSHSPWGEARGGTCAAGRASKINVGVLAAGNRLDILSSCFQEDVAEVFYVEYDLIPQNAVHQSGVGRPSFQQGEWFPGMNVNTLYTQVSQKAAIAQMVGPELADMYVNATFFMARGHLAAKSEMVFGQPQRATFTFLNTAPQWQPFNGGNWNYLEQDLRRRIGEAKYVTRVYTGTWGIMALKDASGTPRDIYLSPNDRKLPVPLWYYKVAREVSTGRATVFLGLNNPHVTLEEARELAFCTDVCKGNSQFSWLTWRYDFIGEGFVMCCDVDDFRRTVNHLPAFTVNGLLY